MSSSSTHPLHGLPAVRASVEWDQHTATIMNNSDLFTNTNDQLHVAANNGDLRMIQQLLAAGADVNDTSSHHPCTPLMDNISNMKWTGGEYEVVEALIEAGADANCSDEMGYTALIRAVQGGRTGPDILQLLIDNHADVDAKNDKGRTALMYASEVGHTEAAQILINAGAGVDVQNAYEQTALFLATEENHTEVVQSLIEAGADVDHQDQKGATALMWAVGRGWSDPTVVQILLDADADTTIVNCKGETAEDQAKGEAKSILVAHRERLQLRRAVGVDEQTQEPPKQRRKM